MGTLNTNVELEKMVNDILYKLQFHNEFSFEYKLKEKILNVNVILPKKGEKFDIPYILVIPQNINENSILTLETNNFEKTNYPKDLLKNAFEIANNLVQILIDSSSPILVPILPSFDESKPYFQQLSKECFDLEKSEIFYRIDNQIVNIINDAKKRIYDLSSIQINEKIFLNGYSSSGVFAQRFSLLHPEIIDTVCIGGAIGSIPMPTDKLNYPLGIGDYKQITGKEFDFKLYSNIKFRYYVGQLEDKMLSDSRYDDFGKLAPMHDMSYFLRSVPVEIGKMQRKLFGENMFQRCEKQINLLEKFGYDIKYKIFLGRTHSNINGVGVNELGKEYISQCYEEMININQKKCK